VVRWIGSHVEIKQAFATTDSSKPIGDLPRSGEHSVNPKQPEVNAMLFCLTANYTPKALEAMGKNPSNRREAVEKLLTAAGGKLVAMYGTIAEGPGAMAIFDIDPAAAPAVVGVVASSDAVHNVKMQRLFSGEEVAAIRQKRAQLQASYKPPGQ
jgi:uncharacterized protein with GYD domain